jgi:hypothetical protein
VDVGLVIVAGQRRGADGEAPAAGIFLSSLLSSFCRATEEGEGIRRCAWSQGREGKRKEGEVLTRFAGFDEKRRRTTAIPASKIARFAALIETGIGV